MKTTKAAVKQVGSSPKALATILAFLSVLGCTVLFILSTEHLHDDLLFLLSATSVVTLALVVAYFLPDWAIRHFERVEPEVVWRIPLRRKRAALTLDDVPLLDDPSNLEALLDVLRDNKVKATLFIMSGFDLETADGGPKPEVRERLRSLLKRAVAEGHELANHLQFDRPAFAMERDEFEAAFNHCDRTIAAYSGGEEAWRARKRRWFRPASALWTEHILGVAKQKGYTTVVANCYPHDVVSLTRHVNAQYLQSRVRPGCVVVVHDRWHTPATLAKALPLIAQNGIELGTLSELQAAADEEAGEKEGKKE